MSRRNRREVPAPDPLAGLEAELRQQAQAPRPPAGDSDGRAVILGYVRDHPGALAREVIARGRGHLSRTKAEEVIRDLLSGKPAQLRSDPPQASGLGHHHERLYPAHPGPDSPVAP